MAPRPYRLRIARRMNLFAFLPPILSLASSAPRFRGAANGRASSGLIIIGSAPRVAAIHGNLTSLLGALKALGQAPHELAETLSLAL